MKIQIHRGIDEIYTSGWTTTATAQKLKASLLLISSHPKPIMVSRGCQLERVKEQNLEHCTCLWGRQGRSMEAHLKEVCGIYLARRLNSAQMRTSSLQTVQCSTSIPRICGCIGPTAPCPSGRFRSHHVSRRRCAQSGRIPFVETKGLGL